MDNIVEWAAPRAAVTATALVGAALGGAALVVMTDAAGRVILGIAGLGLCCWALLGGLRRPRLAITPEPRLLVRGLRTTKTYRPADIVRVHLATGRRVGRRTPMLEIDVTDNGNERLLIFSRWDLGTHPATVRDALAVHGLAPKG